MPEEPDSSPEIPLPPPPSFGRQALQLVVIPAVITVAAIMVVGIFSLVAGREDSLEDQLNRLRQSSGAGRMAFGVQDPRYKDRSLAAARVAGMLADIEDQKQRDLISVELTQILESHVGPEEDLLQVYLLIGIGQIGREGSLPVIARRLDSPRERVRQGAIRGILSWPDTLEASAMVPRLCQALEDPDPTVRAEAAAAVEALAAPGDQASIQALARCMKYDGEGGREAAWNAAVSLARLGDPDGSRVVAEVLLDRPTLAGLAAAESGAEVNRYLSLAGQNRVMLSTLAAAVNMPDPLIWDKISELADSDPSRTVRRAAIGLLNRRRRMETAPLESKGPAEPRVSSDSD